ncbi:hypothetical protein FOZ76_16225 [Verticiella sediminum]|uniref:Uncharacterized protein n=1 Tax=Verticiella sediminum TaxID=1247510 RepID=A0A556AJ76_9BURK|nr:hypothetical protein [Verticiella sediminum]TSH92933.1 hypothetical protein FOZ76_16225 [Verticiella sediminum]
MTLPLDASVHDFSPGPPQQETSHARCWITRAANFVVMYMQARPGAMLVRDAQPDEYMVFCVDALARVRAGTEAATLQSGTLAIVPPGASRIDIEAEGTLVLLFSNRATDLLALAANAAHYEAGAPGVAPLADLPEPAGGFALRTYRVAEHRPTDGNMCVFRSRNLMLNIMLPRQAPRNTRALSPHQHEDFEQGSMALRGDWVHHLRYPWTKDMSQWREDVHMSIGSPSLLVIPPKVIHTSRNVSEGESWLLDIFAPPRADFCARPGMVRNAQDYPYVG